MSDAIYNLNILTLKGKGKFHSLDQRPWLFEWTAAWPLFIVRRKERILKKIEQYFPFVYNVASRVDEAMVAELIPANLIELFRETLVVLQETPFFDSGFVM